MNFQAVAGPVAVAPRLKAAGVQTLHHQPQFFNYLWLF